MIRVMFTCLKWLVITLDWSNVKVKRNHRFRFWIPKILTCKLLMIKYYQSGNICWIWVFSGLGGGLASVCKLTPPEKKKKKKKCRKCNLLFIVWRKYCNFQQEILQQQGNRANVQGRIHNCFYPDIGTALLFLIR